MPQSIIVKRRGLASLFPFKVVATQTNGKLKKAKEQVDKENASNKSKDKA